MANQKQLDGVYMANAIRHAELSTCIRAKVGACIVTTHGVILSGYNGTPKGLSNSCEFIEEETGEYVTKASTLHAELNCIMKAAREGVSVDNATAYVTLAPCLACSAMLIQAGIKRVVFKEHYRSNEGLDLLKEAGIIAEQFD